MDKILGGFDEQARLRVNEAVAAAEKKTAAEILPVVVKSSGSYDRAEDIVGLWTGLILVGLAWFFFQGVVVDAGWSGQPGIRVGFWTTLVLLLVGFIGGIVLANRVRWVRRLFVPGREMETESVARAKAVFFDRRLHRSSAGTGVLLYVSLFERRGLVLVDDAVAAKLSARALDEVRDQMLSGLRDGDLCTGLVAGVERIGSLLADTLPAGENRVDEVKNEVIVME